jgi:hypothetical protein
MKKVATERNSYMCRIARVKLISRREILAAFSALARELTSGSQAEIVVGGGAALVLLYNAREATKDVDALRISTLDSAAVHAAARQVAASLDLPGDWLNDGAKGYLHGLATGEVLFESPSLVIRSVAPQQLLAMKLSAWRDDVDIGDAALLLSKLKGQRTEVWSLVEPFLVPGRELKARYAFEDLWEMQHGPS